MSKTNSKIPKSIIFGFSGTELTAQEKDFFSKENPLGFILFKRNCSTPEQIKRLTSELKSLVGREDTPILIDQEGGKVARLTPPHWRISPPAGLFGELALSNPNKAKEAVYINSRLIAHELFSIGINVDCAPVVDIFYPGAHDIISDRAYGDNPENVAMLAEQVCKGLLDGGVMPIIKHIPGHGRSDQDSHEALPVVRAEKHELDKTDFLAFKKLANMPWAMTAHIKYSAIDDKEPATLSKKVIRLIRQEIGFDGVILTDDISMKALSGSLREICEKSLDAGCDVLLHCNGEMKEMQEIAPVIPALTAAALDRVNNAQSMIKQKNDDFDFDKWEIKLAGLLDNEGKKALA